MRDKDKFDLKKIDELTAESTWRKRLLVVGFKGIPGISAGLVASSSIVGLLALGGIAVAALVHIALAIGAAVFFSGAALIMAGYQHWKEQKRITQLKKELDNQVGALKKQIIDLILNYQEVNDTIKIIQAEIKRLTSILTSDRLNSELEELKRNLQILQQDQENIIDRLKIALNLIAGNTYTDKLAGLFRIENKTEDVRKEAIYDFAQIELDLADEKLPQLENGINNIWPMLMISEKEQSFIYNDQTGDRITNFENDLKKSISSPKDKTHSSIKKATYLLTGIGGFLGGVSASLTIAGLIFGGTAALVAIGWPILVPALGIGIVAMGGALLYHQYVNKKQEKTLNRVLLAKTQIAGANQYLKKQANKPVQQNLLEVKKSYKEAGKDTLTDLSVQEKRLIEYRNKIESTSKTLNHLQSAFNPMPVGPEVDFLQNQLRGNILLLEDLKHATISITVIGPHENKKITLLKEIQNALATAENHQRIFDNLLQRKPQFHSSHGLIEQNETLMKSVNRGTSNTGSSSVNNKQKKDDEEKEGETPTY